MKKTKAFNVIGIDEEDHKNLKIICARLEVSINHCIKTLIKEFIKKELKKL